MNPALVMPLDAFLRSVAVNRAMPHAFFLGAGASISSGVQSAARCVWEWKQSIFLTNQPPDVVPHYQELSLPSVQRRIQEWLDEQGEYPLSGSPEEYGFYAERCHPLAADRVQYFRGLLRGARPGPGYQLLALLAKAGLTRTVWTTNFDSLAAKAVTAAGLEVLEVGEDSADRLERIRSASGMLHVSLHGDYRYDDLRNTPAELREQNERLALALSKMLADTALIVVGYSGRDRSVMRALSRGYATKGVGRLFWCGYQDEEPHPDVATLLRWARDHDREAYYIRTAGFDDLLFRLGTHCLTGEAAAEAQRITAAAASSVDASPPPFRIEHPYTLGVLKSNAFSLRIPGEVLQFRAPEFSGKGAWKALRARTKGTRVIAVPQGGKVLALGLVDEVCQLFNGPDMGPVERSPIADRDLGQVDGAVTSLLTSALVRAIADARGLETNDEDLLWLRGRGDRQVIRGATCYIQQAAIMQLRRQAGGEYLLVKPTIRVTAADGCLASQEIAKEAKRQILGRQWNEKFNEALNKWVERILPKGTATTLEFPPGAASSFSYTLTRVPSFAKMMGPKSAVAVRLDAKIERQVKQVGTQFSEPSLVFASRRSGPNVIDPHPIRGLIENRPYDYALTARGLRSEIRLGAITPVADAATAGDYLARLHQRIDPDSKQEYLLPYPGFQQAFGVALELPDRRTGAWFGVTEPAAGTKAREGAHYLRRQIQQGIDALVGTTNPTVIVVYVPTRWRAWEAYDVGGERFDLHNFIKAYCIQKGVATQFIREETTSKRYQCEVMWWLALSLYVKAMRTPWILDGIDASTAFVGIGFSIDHSGERGKHVLLGCSHIYSPIGLGLTYRLSKIEEGFERRGNPFMSKADARRMAESACELFWDTHQKLPARVVLHRKTPFRSEERAGLLEGLYGVKHVDMVEINVDSMLRYVAARPIPGGSFRGDAYPVRRGSAVVMERDKALLWVHGAADPVMPGGRPYYQGKSRIPAPLVIKRHYGSSSLDILAHEILGLSKMNWNTFDMYTKLPATIESSNRIARIGALIERTQPASYDYRLFI